MTEFDEGAFTQEEMMAFIVDARRSKESLAGVAFGPTSGAREITHSVLRDDGVEVAIAVIPVIVAGEPQLAIRRFEIRNPEDREHLFRWQREQRSRRS
jgi:hypothetical protein